MWRKVQKPTTPVNPDYLKIRRRLRLMSFRDLLSQLDQYTNDLILNIKKYRQFGGRLEYIQELQRTLIHLQAIVDELEDENNSRGTNHM